MSLVLEDTAVWGRWREKTGTQLRKITVTTACHTELAV
jgi:hypothetical protein